MLHDLVQSYMSTSSALPLQNVLSMHGSTIAMTIAFLNIFINVYIFVIDKMSSHNLKLILQSTITTIMKQYLLDYTLKISLT